MQRRNPASLVRLAANFCRARGKPIAKSMLLRFDGSGSHDGQRRAISFFVATVDTYAGGDPAVFSRDIPAGLEIVCCDLILIVLAALGSRIPSVFVDHKGHGPSLKLAKAADDAPSSVLMGELACLAPVQRAVSGAHLSLVTMDQYGMITAIEDNSKSSGDFVIGNKGCTVILTRHTDLVVRDVILFQELGIGLGIWLGHQSPTLC